MIGILNVNRGDFVTNQTVISTIDDREHILIDFYVPERLVGAIEIGTPVVATSVACGCRLNSAIETNKLGAPVVYDFKAGCPAAER